jgi:hypothetical protein
MFADVAHEQDRAILSKKSRRTRVRCRNGKLETALGVVPELSVPIELECDLLIVFDHVFDASYVEGIHELSPIQQIGWIGGAKARRLEVTTIL